MFSFSLTVLSHALSGLMSHHQSHLLSYNFLVSCPLTLSHITQNCIMSHNLLSHVMSCVILRCHYKSQYWLSYVMSSLNSSHVTKVIYHGIIFSCFTSSHVKLCYITLWHVTSFQVTWHLVSFQVRHVTMLTFLSHTMSGLISCDWSCIP